MKNYGGPTAIAASTTLIASATPAVTPVAISGSLVDALNVALNGATCAVAAYDASANGKPTQGTIEEDPERGTITTNMHGLLPKSV